MQAWITCGTRNHKGCPEVAKRKALGPLMQVRGSETPDISYSHSIVKNYLQFAAVRSSSSHLHPVSKIAVNPWGQIWVTDFGSSEPFPGVTWGHEKSPSTSACMLNPDCGLQDIIVAGDRIQKICPIDAIPAISGFFDGIN